MYSIAPLFPYLERAEKFVSENTREVFLCHSCPNISSTVLSSWQHGLLTLICKYRAGQPSLEKLHFLAVQCRQSEKVLHPQRGRESMDLSEIKSPLPTRDGAHLDVIHKSQLLSLLTEFILSEAETWLNLGSRLPSSFIEWCLSLVRGKRRPCQTKLG